MTGKYYHTKETVEEYINLAKDVNSKNLIAKFASFMNSNAKVLEIGSGPGTDWRILNKTFKVTGSDNSKEFIEHLTKENPGGSFLELDAVTLLTEEKYDSIYSNKVLHHLNNRELEQSVKKQYEILKPNGLICHSFWKGEGDEIFNGLYVNYHLEKDLHHFFEPFFDILKIEAYKEFENGDSLLVIGKKK